MIGAAIGGAPIGGVISGDGVLLNWWGPYSEPIEKAKRRCAEYRAFTYGPVTPIHLPDWYQNLSTPPKAKPRVIEFPAFTTGRPHVDVWWYSPLSEPQKLYKDRVVEFQAYAYPPYNRPADVEWWVNWTQPKRDPFGQRYYLIESVFEVSRVNVYLPYSMGYIIV